MNTFTLTLADSESNVLSEWDILVHDNEINWDEEDSDKYDAFDIVLNKGGIKHDYDYFLSKWDLEPRINRILCKHI